ncbi:MAG: deoxyribodipyrimidine photo-lyase [Burkholderiales bacterium]|jgi:deoxyribodipyrimidine photo-lyase|nr:deoxyribodipyrimidine photo-lyase [Burkholderiales bacterium]MBP9768228.1 deoxyribodipyrimidine photo-lyase [Burkholderiales bacterium]
MAATHNQIPTQLFWFRRDLRLKDNHGLFSALNNGKVIACFVWDRELLDTLPLDNPHVNFIHQSVCEIKQQLQLIGSDLIILHGNTQEQLLNLLTTYKIKTLHWNEDYDPSVIIRDQQIQKDFMDYEIHCEMYKDQTIFAKREILTQQSKPYTVYTAYKNTWLKKLAYEGCQSYLSENLLTNFHQLQPQKDYFTPLQHGFERIPALNGGANQAQQRLFNFTSKLATYNLNRNYPFQDLTSYIGVDLRFGTLSIRQAVQLATSQNNDGSLTWLSELIWRDFFSQVLFNFPYVVTQAFRIEYNNLAYTNNPVWFTAWCNGQTGFPIVDAGMRQLNQTGFMHNRVRMICASFLCKDLLIDWRWGETYFAKKLLDYDLASNNGNWQWCASTGCDAQPYFRIFNPYLQSQKFDPDGEYIRKFIPELSHLDNKAIHCPSNADLFSTTNYPTPIVNHPTQVKLAKIMFATIKKD